MMERKFVAQKLKEFRIQEFLEKHLGKVGHSHTKIKKTPLGEKIIIHASRPGLIVGRKGENIKSLNIKLKKSGFELDNPQIEINEVEIPYLDASIVAEKVAGTLEQFGANRFKGVGNKMVDEVMRAGALGVEITISGKLPSSRAKNWRFYRGYLKKSGDIEVTGIRKSYKTAELKTGTVGIQVKIMPPDIVLPDSINILSEEPIIEEIKEEVKVEEKGAEEVKETQPEEQVKGSKKEEKSESKDETKPAEKKLDESNEKSEKEDEEEKVKDEVQGSESSK